MMKFVVLCCVIAAAAARAPVYFAPAVAPLEYAVPLHQAHYNYRGPLSLAPGQPANILAADGRPLDTLDVNLDRTAHFVAKAIDNAPHALTKRSVTRLAVAPGPVGYTAALASGNIGIATPFGSAGINAAIATNPSGLTSVIAAAPIGVSAPVTQFVSTPITAGAVAVTPIAAGSIGISASGIPLVRNF